MIAKLFQRRRPPAPLHVVPVDERVYAIGDVHGCLELLDDLLARIEEDDHSRGPAETCLILLGDLIDRGPDSAAVVARSRALAAERPNTRFLLGNHEEVFLGALDGEEKALRMFTRIGGRETALSYGITSDEYDRADYDELHQLLLAHVPEQDRLFLRSFEDVIQIGDYAFVHAGIDPLVPIESQKPEDLRWIRDRFLKHPGPFAQTIVHGHTICEQPDMNATRIGIDTGAYATGRLSALGLEGDSRWILKA